MIRPYFLRTDRLGFDVWTPDDLPLALDLWGDVRVTRLIGGPFSEEQVRQRLEQEIANQAAHGVQYWPVFRLKDGEHVGCCGLRPYPEREGALELGFHICYGYWRQGYASEAAQAVIRYAFNMLHVSGLFAGHNPENVASHLLLERLGFRYTHDAFYKPTGLYHPSYIMTASDFAQSVLSARRKIFK
jgi:ribosomal-protein-alanine N-acetyltransferase